jgi:hypothetical protein
MKQHKFIKNDYVSWENENNTMYGYIVQITDDKAKIRIKGRWDDEPITMPLNKLTYLPPVLITAEDQRRFFRFEISQEELLHGNVDADYRLLEDCQIHTEDLLAAIRNIQKRKLSPEEYEKQWLQPLYEMFYDDGGVVYLAEAGFSDESDWDGFPTEETVFRFVYYTLVDGCDTETAVDLEMLIREIETWLANKDKPAREKALTLNQKRDFFSCWNNRPLEQTSAWLKDLFRNITDELCKLDDPEALETKAYACYGNGNAIYEQDWFASRDCLLKLMKMNPRPPYANTLGYIFYYGRCNNGTPEYEKAFYYFSIGAAGGHPESRYKLADMFLHGYGVAKNERTAASIIWEMYHEKLKEFCQGELTSDFADVAFRAGNLYRDGIACWRDYDAAYYYYLQARFAIRMRMLQGNIYGDSRVAANIEEAIQSVLPETRYQKKQSVISYPTMSFWLRNGLKKRHHMKMMIKKKGNMYKISFWIVPFADEKYRPKLFVTIPEAARSGFWEKLNVLAKNVKTFVTADMIAPATRQSSVSGNNDKDNNATIITFDNVEGPDYYYYGKKVATIDAEYVLFLNEKDEKKYRFASVAFTPGGKLYDYLCDIDLKPGDKAIVVTERGETCVTVMSITEKTEAEMMLALDQYKHIVRKVKDV